MKVCPLCGRTVYFTGMPHTHFVNYECIGMKIMECVENNRYKQMTAVERKQVELDEKPVV